MEARQPSEPHVINHRRYRSGEELGRGSQGVVLRVVDREAPERPLVAKVFRGQQDPQAWRAEFRLLGRLELPGLVRARDLCRDEVTKEPFLVEDFVPGVAIDVAVQRVPEAARAECLAQLLIKAAHALAALHDAGFVHGDLKPAHVKVTPTNEVVLLDLGSAAQQTSAAPPSGTPGFLAPERTEGSRATIASDLYALGALAFRAAAGTLAEPGQRGVRAELPWLGARLADLLEALLARDPQNRPRDARDVLTRIGRALPSSGGRRYFGTLGREQELAALGGAKPIGVLYVTGPSGIGKSHLLRELWIDAVLRGRPARLVSFPDADEAAVSAVIGFLKGDLSAPDAARDARALLLLDGLEHAPRELGEAVEGYRCRERAPAVDVLVAARRLPPSAPALELSPLPDEAMAKLAHALARDAELDSAPALRASQGNPGWLGAALGGAPVTLDLARERLQGLSPEAGRWVFAVALSNAELPEALLRAIARAPAGAVPPGLGEAFDTGLLARRITPRGPSYVLPVPALADELVRALFEEQRDTLPLLARALLDCPEAGAQQLLRVAEQLPPEPLREAVLVRAIERARQCAMPSLEIAALFALLGPARERDSQLLLRLERLARDTGRQAEYPSTLDWLACAAESDPRLEPLVLRRRAESAARRGDPAAAQELIAQAKAAAQALGSKSAEGLVHASAGALFLYRADWRSAEGELGLAERLLRDTEDPDAEELARLEHNRGVVALYAGRLAEAKQRFQQAIAKKRRLGDLSGVRACLLNLGLTATKLGAHEEAEVALDEAVALARSLGQRAGEAWSLSARSELEVERKRADRAEHWLSQANELAEAAPAVVRTDLRLLAARIALLRSDGKGALALVDRLEPELFAADAAHQCRIFLIRAEAALLQLPAQPRRAARLAAQALRLAREAALAELEKCARELLLCARPGRHAPKSSYPELVNRDETSPEWRWLHELVGSGDADAMLLALCRLAIERTSAERALLVLLDAQGSITRAWGTDLEGFALANAEARVGDDVQAALSAHEAWFYQRDLRGGSRVAARAALGSGRFVAVVLEHRFRAAQFDKLSAAELERWALLAAVALRLAPAAAPSNGSRERAADQPEVATRLPLRAARRAFPSIVGSSAALEPALQRLDAAIDSPLPVLIRGETGTGKELFARAVHEHGPRRGHAFVAVNCAAIADSLFEAELFGHSRGAFTGAERARAGLLSEAEGGTLLLDEIGELSAGRQATLLRLLESGRYRAVGSDREQVSSARIVAATNRDLEQAVANGQFRRDLLFRINVLEIQIPPLRERSEDIARLAQIFLERANPRSEISRAALEALTAYDWPGNVRELSHLIERLVALGARRIELEDLPRALRRNSPASVDSKTPDAAPLSERDEVTHALARCNGNISQAARALGLSRHGLKKRMLRLGLRCVEKNDV